MTKCYFEDGYLDTNVYLWEELPCGHSIQGPAIIIDKNRQELSSYFYSIFCHNVSVVLLFPH